MRSEILFDNNEANCVILSRFLSVCVCVCV